MGDRFISWSYEYLFDVELNGHEFGAPEFAYENPKKIADQTRTLLQSYIGSQLSTPGWSWLRLNCGKNDKYYRKPRQKIGFWIHKISKQIKTIKAYISDLLDLTSSDQAHQRTFI